jgi:hypothetical protein
MAAHECFARSAATRRARCTDQRGQAARAAHETGLLTEQPPQLAWFRHPRLIHATMIAPKLAKLPRQHGRRPIPEGRVWGLVPDGHEGVEAQAGL